MTFEELRGREDVVIQDNGVFLHVPDGMTWEEWFPVSDRLRWGLLEAKLDWKPLYLVLDGHIYLNSLIWERGRFKYFQQKAIAERDGREFVPPVRPNLKQRDITHWRRRR